MKAIPDLLTHEEIQVINDYLSEAQFQDGKLTAGDLIKHRKNNLQLNNEDEGRPMLDSVIVNALTNNEIVNAFAAPKRFSAPLYAKYDPGMKYDAHVDANLMGSGNDRIRSDLSITIFLNNPDEYEGGELAIDVSGSVQLIKLPAGSAFIYPTTYLHQVNKVTSGQRRVAVLWAQSLVRDNHIRETLFDIIAANSVLQTKNSESIESKLLHKSLLNLQRHFFDI